MAVTHDTVAAVLHLLIVDPAAQADVGDHLVNLLHDGRRKIGKAGDDLPAMRNNRSCSGPTSRA